MSDITDIILTKASQLMERYGISSVTMDDIAKECHISKRTLYEQIPDKRTLVWHCILYNRKRRQDEALILVNKAESTLDALLRIHRNARKGLTESSSIFFKDLHRLYPDIEKMCRDINQEQSKSFGEYLTKGVNEGMFRADIDFDLAAKIFMAQSNAIMKELSTTNEPQMIAKTMSTAFIIFLRGIATQKGLEINDDFFKENNI